VGSTICGFIEGWKKGVPPGKRSTTGIKMRVVKGGTPETEPLSKHFKKGGNHELAQGPPQFKEFAMVEQPKSTGNYGDTRKEGPVGEIQPERASRGGRRINGRGKENKHKRGGRESFESAGRGLDGKEKHASDCRLKEARRVQKEPKKKNKMEVHPIKRAARKSLQTKRFFWGILGTRRRTLNWEGGILGKSCQTHEFHGTKRRLHEEWKRRTYGQLKKKNLRKRPMSGSFTHASLNLLKEGGRPFEKKEVPPEKGGIEDP